MVSKILKLISIMKKIFTTDFFKSNISILSAFLCLFLIYIFFPYNFSYSIPNLGHEFTNIRINLAGENTKVKADNIELEPVENFPFTKYKVFAVEYFPIKKLEVFGDEAVISIGDKYHFIQKPDGDLNLKYRNNGKYITDRGMLKSFQIRFLSMFYNSIVFMYLFFGLFLFFALKKTRHYLLFYILALCLILRLGDLSQGLWTDEFYTVYIAGSNNMPFMQTFLDPGNPPLFYIFIRFFQEIFGDNYACLRIVPIAFSFGSVLLTYFIIKKYSNTVTALLFSFLLSINTYSIVSAQELRCYSAVYFFSLCLTIYLFKIIENPDKKNFILYSLFGCALVNLHYYGFIILLFNFIFGMFFIKKRIYFVLANAFSVITFLPYFFKTSLHQALLDKTFNNDIYKSEFFYYRKAFVRLSQGVLSSIIIFSLGIFSLIKKNKFFGYNFLLICFVLLFCYIAQFIRPIMRGYYFVTILPNFIILSSYMFSFKKLKYFILIAYLFSCFTCKNYIHRLRDSSPDWESLVQYSSNDKAEGGKMLLVKGYKKDLKISGRIGDDISVELVSDLRQVDEIIKRIDNTKAKNTYFRVPAEVAYKFLKEASKKYKTDFIRIRHDFIIVKVQK